MASALGPLISVEAPEAEEYERGLLDAYDVRREGERQSGL